MSFTVVWIYNKHLEIPHCLMLQILFLKREQNSQESNKTIYFGWKRDSRPSFESPFMKLSALEASEMILRNFGINQADHSFFEPVCSLFISERIDGPVKIIAL